MVWRFGAQSRSPAVVDSSVVCKHACIYELRDPPGLRLRRWPRRSTLGRVGRSSGPGLNPWSVMEEHRWLWDE